MNSPKRGEVWWVDFDPTVGDEMKKRRPAVVLSVDSLRVLGVRLAAPVTGRAPLPGKPWLVPVRGFS